MRMQTHERPEEVEPDIQDRRLFCEANDERPEDVDVDVDLNLEKEERFDDTESSGFQEQTRKEKSRKVSKRSVLTLSGFDDKAPPLDFLIAKAFLDISGKDSVVSLMEYNKKEVLLIYSHVEGRFLECDCNRFAVELLRKFEGTKVSEQLSHRIVKNVFYRLVSNPILQGNLEEFDKAEGYLNVRNGVVDLEDGSLLKHDVSFRFLSMLNVEYKEDFAKSKKIPNAFKSMLERHFPCKDDRNLFLESLAYLISWKHGAKIAFFWIGEPHTAKSTFERILTSFLGGAVTHHSLKQISSKHGTADLEGARVNICAEVEKEEIKNLDNFKAIVGNDFISIEPKFQKLRTMKCTTDLLLIGNDFMPLAKDVAEPALYDRIIFIRFKNPYGAKERIWSFDEQMVENEGSKIFAVIVRYLRRLRDNQYRFTRSAQSEQEKLRFIQQNMPLKSVDCFIEDRCMVSVDEIFLASEEIYKFYEEYSRTNGFDPISKRKFFGEFPHKMLGIKPAKRKNRVTGKECRGYVGLCIK